jgi:type III pantothenate kinase
MLLTIDVGNTSIALGVFEGPRLIKHWKIRSEREKTCDEYGITLMNLFSLFGLKRTKVKSVILCSVVPPLTPVFQELARRLFQIKALVVGPGLKTGMPILYENPLEVGADRVVSAVAAFSKYGGPCIVVDFGTATTFDAISPKGEYLGGAIAPGMQIAAEALYLRTAKLPRIEIRKPRKPIGRTTVASMQSGIYFGYVGLVSGIIQEIEKELGEEAKVLSTGAMGAFIHGEIASIDFYEPHLVLHGLRLIHERNQEGSLSTSNKES